MHVHGPILCWLSLNGCEQLAAAAAQRVMARGRSGAYGPKLCVDPLISFGRKKRKTNFIACAIYSSCGSGKLAGPARQQE